MIDEELKRLLVTKANEFAMDPSIPSGVMVRARSRVVRAATGLVMAAALFAAAGIVVLRSDRSAVPDRGGDAVRLVAYVSADMPTHEDGPTDDAAEVTSLRRFADCMRAEGLTVPDPVKTREGWTIPVTSRPPDTPAWREAAFVRCRPTNVHLTGDLVLGGRSATEIEAFRDCLLRDGYELPEPTPDGNEYVFDLRGTGFDTDTDAFHRAVMVTCAPGLP